MRKEASRLNQAYRKYSSVSICTSSGTDELSMVSQTHDTDSDSDTCILDDWDNLMYSDDSDSD